MVRYDFVRKVRPAIVIQEQVERIEVNFDFDDLLRIDGEEAGKATGR